MSKYTVKTKKTKESRWSGFFLRRFTRNTVPLVDTNMSIAHPLLMSSFYTTSNIDVYEYRARFIEPFDRDDARLSDGGLAVEERDTSAEDDGFDGEVEFVDEVVFQAVGVDLRTAKHGDCFIVMGCDMFSKASAVRVYEHEVLSFLYDARY